MIDVEPNKEVVVHHPAEMHTFWTCVDGCENMTKPFVPCVGRMVLCPKGERGDTRVENVWWKHVPCGKPATIKKIVCISARETKAWICGLCGKLTTHLYNGVLPPVSGRFAGQKLSCGGVCIECWHGMLDTTMFITVLETMPANWEPDAETDAELKEELATEIFMNAESAVEAENQAYGE